jgi:hypothetical protein
MRLPGAPGALCSRAQKPLADWASLTYNRLVFEIPHTVAETEPFLKQAATLWDEKERQEFVDFIAVNPLAGAEIIGTAGMRKIRWTRAGMGKRGALV